MNDVSMRNLYGTVTAPATLTIERLLPGPIERVWDYLTKSDMRRQWLASGDMELKAGAPFSLTWRNDELTDPPGRKPEGMGGTHTMQSEILAVDPPRSLAFTFGTAGEVSFTLEERVKDVLLTVVHKRVPDRSVLLSVSSGWHMHLDVLAARLKGETPEPFWDGITRLKAEYERRMPA
jgi:uncharacterized protein YndB with AHSA1/START domain